MRNKPKKVVNKFCGNGILEKDEECDCGTSKICETQTCCNMSTCKLTTNSTCGTGICCDFETCQPTKNTKRVCRPELGYCDMPEYCDASSEFCPTDIKVENGVKCHVDGVESYCYDGLCKSRESQCKLLWGPTAKVSAANCWKQNLNGTIAANCGVEHHLHNKPDTYLKCDLADIYCGRLLCIHDSEELHYGWKGSSNQMHILMSKFLLNFNFLNKF